MGDGSVGQPSADGADSWDFGALILDQFLPPNKDGSHWRIAVKITGDIGYDVLNIAAFSKYNGAPLWARSTMCEDWADLYLEKEYFQVDPLIAHMRTSNEQLKFDCDGPPIPGLDPKVEEFRQDAKRMGYGRFRGFPFNWPTQGVHRIISFGLMAGGQTKETCHMVKKAQILAEVLATRIGAPGGSTGCGVVWPSKTTLTDRECELLHFLALGLKNDRIAERCGLAEVTVRKHLLNARHKLGATTREQALAIALQDGLIKF